LKTKKLLKTRSDPFSPILPQPQDETFGFTASAVEFFVSGSAGDGVEKLSGVRAYAFGEGDLVDGHGDTFRRNER